MSLLRKWTFATIITYFRKITIKLRISLQSYGSEVKKYL